MGRLKRSALLTLVLAGLCLGAAPAAAQTIATIFQRHQLPIRSGQLETVKVTCPKGYKALGGSTYPLPSDVRLLKSAPLNDARIFLFEPAGYGPTTVTLVVTCFKNVFAVKGKRLTVKVTSKNGATFQLPVGTKLTKKLRCPRGQAPAGAGLSVTPSAGGGRARAALDVRAPQVAIEAKFMEVGAWHFRFANMDGPAASVTPNATCIPRVTQGPGDTSKRITITRRTFDETIKSPGDGQEHRCRRGFVPIDVGWRAPADGSLQLLGAHPNLSLEASWLWLNRSDAIKAATEYLLCMEARKQRLIRRP